MILKAKTFDELTTTELYEILKARAEIFIVEQSIVYQDLDDMDYESLHVFYEDEGRVAAYLRAFYLDDNTVKIGRVLTIEHGKGLGGKLLENGLEQIKQKMAPERICIDAQSYATGYYEKAGFCVCSEEFLEEGLMHVKMILEL